MFLIRLLEFASVFKRYKRKMLPFKGLFISIKDIKKEDFISKVLLRDPLGARTQDPNIKSVRVEILYVYIYQLVIRFIKVLRIRKSTFLQVYYFVHILKIS